MANYLSSLYTCVVGYSDGDKKKKMTSDWSFSSVASNLPDWLFDIIMQKNVIIVQITTADTRK